MRQEIVGRTKADVTDELVRMRVKYSKQGRVEALKTSMSDYLTEWLERKKDAIAFKTYELYDGAIQKHIGPIGRISVSKLTTANLEFMLGRMKTNGTGARMRQIVRGVLSMALTEGVDRGIIDRNVCAPITKAKVTPKAIKPLNRDQARALLAAAASDPLEALYCLAVATGMRQGELLALHWSDVDFAGSQVSVRHTLTRIESGELVRGDTKTPAGRRSVALPAVAVESLRRHQQRAFEDGKRAHPWVFCDAAGQPLTKGWLVVQSFQPLLKLAGLSPIRFHDLRHTAATLLLADGQHPKIVQEMLGHSSISITLDLYSHVTPSMQRGSADRMNAILSAS
ncbi:MAG TPA: tyrosine-type recombinase/integrase [Candidatus Eremiobacteraceae bacterium]